MNYRKIARGRPCMIRIADVCNGDPETTVLAHLPGGGMGRKRHDLHGAWSCSACHDACDGRLKTTYEREFLRSYHLEAVIRTQEALIAEGLL